MKTCLSKFSFATRTHSEVTSKL